MLPTRPARASPSGRPLRANGRWATAARSGRGCSDVTGWRRCRARLLVPLLVLGLAGCASAPAADPGRPAARGATAGIGTVGSAATTTPGAQLRAGLTYLLVERVHLLRAAQVTEGGRAGAALDACAEELATEVAARVGAGSGRLRADVLSALRREARGVTGRDQAEAVAGRTALLAALSRSVPRLAGAPLDAALTAAVAPALAGVPPGAAADSGAAQAAGLLANAVAAQAGLGSTETSAATLRAHLTGLLTARTYLHVEAARDPVDPTTAALEADTVALADLLSDGERTLARDLAAALRAGSEALSDAAAAGRGGDAARGVQARAGLEAARRELTARLAEAVPALPAGLVGPELARQEHLVLAAVGAAVAADPAAGPALRDVAAGAPVAAALLAGGLADHRHLS